MMLTRGHRQAQAAQSEGLRAAESASWQAGRNAKEREAEAEGRRAMELALASREEQVVALEGQAAELHAKLERAERRVQAREAELEEARAKLRERDTALAEALEQVRPLPR